MIASTPLLRAAANGRPVGLDVTAILLRARAMGYDMTFLAEALPVAGAAVRDALAETPD